MENKIMKSNRKMVQVDFITNMNAYMLFWIFMIGNVLGFLIEGIWAIIKTGHWEHHAATVWGPFCIIYGAGAVLVYVFSYIMRNKNIALQFTAYMVAGSLVEYFFSLFQEVFFGSVSWDYSSHFLNIGGRVSLRMTLIWGVLGILVSKFVFPALIGLIMKLKGRKAFVATWLLIVFMAINLIITCMAVTRWRVRIGGTTPSNIVEETIDSLYDDEKMDELFPTMCFLKQANEN